MIQRTFNILLSIILFIIAYNNGITQNLNDKFLIDWVENADYKELTSRNINSFSINNQVVTSYVESGIKRDVPFNWYEYESYQEFKNDTLSIFELKSYRIERRKIKKEFKRLGFQVSNKGPKLQLYPPVIRNDSYFVTLKMRRNSSYYGNIVLVWVIKYDNTWSFENIKFGVGFE